jgi:hypothetical protein
MVGKIEKLLVLVSAPTVNKKRVVMLTKRPIFFILIIAMRLKYFTVRIQGIPVSISLFILLAFFGCSRTSSELPVMPPATNPLFREYIGFGVVNISFAHVLNEPGPAGVSQGHLRRGTVVRIIERRQVNNRGSSEIWVLAEGNYHGPGSISRGWLQEVSLEVYDSERRANTASRSMSNE